MHFIIMSRLAGVVLIIGATLLTPHRLVSGATTMVTNHHLRSERQANAGHQHVAHLDENTEADKFLRSLANQTPSTFPSDPPSLSIQPSDSVQPSVSSLPSDLPSLSIQPSDSVQPSVSSQPSIEPSLSIQPSITDLCSPGNFFCQKDAICALEAPSDAGSKGYSCTCKDGYTGDGYFYPCLWYDECANEYPCAPPEQGGYCEDRAPDAAILPTKYACGCRNGFTPGAEFAKEGRGPLSCIEFDECVSTQDNGEPVHNCDSEHGICTNTVGSFTCSCEEGFTGDGTTCTEVPPLPETDPDDGLTDPCYSCIDKVSQICGHVEKACICAPGFFAPSGFGGACQSIDECSDDAQNDCDANAHCIELDGGFDCLCKPGFVGNGRTCSDENECADESLFQCDPNAECVSKVVGTYGCQCLAGYDGDGKTCSNLDECALGVDSCDSNAECFDTDGSFTCACNAGYEGDGMVCADTNECMDQLVNVCTGPGEMCFNTVGSFECRTPGRPAIPATPGPSSTPSAVPSSVAPSSAPSAVPSVAPSASVAPSVMLSAVPSVAPPYEVLSESLSECPAGLEVSLADCPAVGKSFGFTFKQELDSDTFPCGCFLRSGKDIYFNSSSATPCKASDDNQVVCKTK